MNPRALAAKASPIDPQAEAALWRDFKTGASTSAREALFSLHFGHARQIARRHYLDLPGAGVDYGDLCQMAGVGLLEAIDRYDPDLGVPFRAYATRRITGAVLDGLAKASEVRQQIWTRQKIRAERARSLLAEDHRLQGAQALQALMDVAVGLAVGFMLDETSLYVAEDQADRQPNAYDSLAWRDALARMRGEVSRLPEREAAVVRHHYINGLTFDQIGSLLGVTRGRVSQIHKAAIERLRARLKPEADFEA